MIGKICVAAGLMAVTASALAADMNVAATAAQEKLKGAGFDQKLGAQIPLDLKFTDDTGAEVRLGKYFSDGKPVILTLNYYGCPMLCTYILNGVVDALKDVDFQLGKDIDVVTVSFDPRDTTAIASKKKANYVASLGQKGAEKGWHFLTGKKEQIDQLCSAVGFSYVFDEKSGEFGHASGIMIATPQGKLSHYFYGMMYEAKDVRLALVEASKNKIGSPVDKFLLFCFHYDPVSGKYSAAIMNIIRAGCITAMALVFGFLIFAFRREFRSPRKAPVT